MRPYFIGSFVLLAILLASCAANAPMVADCYQGEPYGFWSGLWHGFIAPFGFFGSLVWDTVSMYAPHNNGHWYALGYLIGSGGWGVLASNSGKIKVKRSRVEVIS